ncbi:MAG TPA: D-2-hydroxyacid dehydrogenase [Bryobacteraceae bacterium]|nr:D-2-hydroxyacid dehydrogenase [Bryobacteraceae bacterium]
MRPFNLIVIANPNDRHLAVLEQLPDSTTITVGKTMEAFTNAAEEADVILNCMGVGGTLRELWPTAKNVKWVHSLSAGVESVLFPELIESKVPVTNSRGVFKDSLGEFAVASILYFAKDLRRMMRNQMAQRWEQFDVEMIDRQTVGIVGYGEIGKAAATRARALGMKVLATRRRPDQMKDDPIVSRAYQVEDRAELMAASDYIVVATPLTPETRGIVAEKELRAMKNTGVIINLGRGPTIDEPSLIRALQEGWIRGAALDVFDVEPLPPGHPFWTLENVLLSPHCADHTSDWLESAMRFFVGNFERFVEGAPLQNLVDKRAGY